LGNQFYRQTVQQFGVQLDLNYTIFDFGGRAGRIAEARANLFAANFAFNDVHRKIICEVTKTYYQLLNAIGQEKAARASLTNAEAVEQAAEDRPEERPCNFARCVGGTKRSRAIAVRSASSPWSGEE
jgi:outer membrane protein TolC